MTTRGAIPSNSKHLHIRTVTCVHSAVSHLEHEHEQGQDVQRIVAAGRTVAGQHPPPQISEAIV
ncbi:hypothetical protein AJ79_08042 [Helicocarpus griseus UAMH5409]|uniref:Uncharacterized protein n=1 Tax=Helicocarpus griseus UAMH5409 TaxID=1447875 RepID=A0A2B7WX38_9EURO|nr:hypothetical protein AJ79_08042 [Helicocarpus griseus UAMH5409]